MTPKRVGRGHGSFTKASVSQGILARVQIHRFSNLPGGPLNKNKAMALNTLLLNQRELQSHVSETIGINERYCGKCRIPGGSNSLS